MNSTEAKTKTTSWGGSDAATAGDRSPGGNSTDNINSDI